MKNCPMCKNEIPEVGGFTFVSDFGMLYWFCSEACFEKWADGQSPIPIRSVK